MDLPTLVQVEIQVPTRVQQAALAEEGNEHVSEILCKEPSSSVREDLGCLTETSLVQIVGKYILENEIKEEWTQHDDYLIVKFHCHILKLQELVELLDQTGIGKLYNTYYRITPCLVYKSSRSISDDESSSELSTEDDSGFLKVTRPLVPVQHILDGTRVAATINFDYTALLLCSALLAATALVENNSEILVASVLISPIMGPVLAGTFGFSVGDRSLWKHGVANEFISLAYCLLLGFLYGIIYANISIWNNGLYVNEIMKTRGQIRSLLFTCIVAVPSGLGVALAVLGNNTGPLVGVGISASLLPPVVNSGLLFAFSLIQTFMGNLTLPEDYEPVYSTALNEEMACLGGVSFCLTLVSIMCIAAMTLIILKIKQLTPRSNMRFFKNIWTKDLPTVRQNIFRGKSGAGGVVPASDYDPYKTTFGLPRLFDDLQGSHREGTGSEHLSSYKTEKGGVEDRSGSKEAVHSARHRFWRPSVRGPIVDEVYNLDSEKPDGSQKLLGSESFRFYGSL